MITIHCVTLLNHSYQEQYFPLFVNLNYHVYHYYIFSRTSRKRTPTGPRESVRLREVSAYGRVKKNALEAYNAPE